MKNEREMLTARHIIAVALLFMIISMIITNFSGSAAAEEAVESDNERCESVIIPHGMDTEVEEISSANEQEYTTDDPQEQPMATVPSEGSEMNDAMTDAVTLAPSPEALDIPEQDAEQEPMATDAPEGEMNETTTDAPASDAETESAPEVTGAPTAEPAEESEPANTPKPRSRKRKEPTLYDVPQELLDADPAFAAIMAEASKYVGYPYVWGGSNPRTSFDCSGFVSWVYTESGVSNTGRKGATGLYKLCTEVSPEEARPGDLVFFKGTMGPDVPGVTHVGIYVGNGWMLHCGDPIGYADLTQERWVKRFFTFGRLTYEEEYANVHPD